MKKHNTYHIRYIINYYDKTFNSTLILIQTNFRFNIMRICFKISMGSYQCQLNPVLITFRSSLITSLSIFSHNHSTGSQITP